MNENLLGKLTVEVTGMPDHSITGSAKFEGNYADLVSGLFFAMIIQPDFEKMIRAVIDALESEKGKQVAAQIRSQIEKSENI